MRAANKIKSVDAVINLNFDTKAMIKNYSENIIILTEYWSGKFSNYFYIYKTYAKNAIFLSFLLIFLLLYFPRFRIFQNTGKYSNEILSRISIFFDHFSRFPSWKEILKR